MPTVVRTTAQSSSLTIGALAINASSNPRALIVVAGLRSASGISGVTLAGNPVGSSIVARASDMYGTLRGQSAWLIEEADLPAGGSTYSLVVTASGGTPTRNVLTVIEIDDFGSIEATATRNDDDNNTTVTDATLTASAGSLQLSVVHGQDAQGAGTSTVDPTGGAVQTETGGSAVHASNIDLQQAGQSSSSGSVTHSWTTSETITYLGMQMFSVIGPSAATSASPITSHQRVARNVFPRQ